MHKQTLFTTVLLASILAGSRGGYVEHFSPSGPNANYHQPRTMMNNGYTTSEVNKQSSDSPISPASYMVKRSDEPDHSTNDGPTSTYNQAPGQERSTSACQAPFRTPLFDHAASSNAPSDQNNNATASQPHSSQAPANAPPSPISANTTHNAGKGITMLKGVPYYGRSSNSSSLSSNVLSSPQLQPGSSKNSGGQAPPGMTTPSTSEDGSHTDSSSSPSPSSGYTVLGQPTTSSPRDASDADDDSFYGTPFHDQSAVSHAPSNDNNNAGASQRHSSQAPAIATPSRAVANTTRSADNGMNMLAGMPSYGRPSNSSSLSSNVLSPSQLKPGSYKSSAGKAPSSKAESSTSQDTSHTQSSSPPSSQSGMRTAPEKSTNPTSPAASDADDDSPSYIQSIPMEAEDVPSDSSQRDSSPSGGPSQPSTEGEPSNASDRSASPAAPQEAPSGRSVVPVSKSSLVPNGFSLKLLHNSSTEVSGSTARSSEPNSGPTLTSGSSELPEVVPTSIEGPKLQSHPVSTLLRRDALPLPKPRLSRPKCPQSMRACLTRTSGMMQSPRGDKWECLDFDDLVSCGGCTTEGTGRDCTQIPGIDGAACENDQCKILTCLDSHIMKDGRCVAK